MPTSGPLIAASVKGSLQGSVTVDAVKALLLAKLQSRGFKLTATPDGKVWVDEYASALAEALVDVIVTLLPAPLGDGIYQQLTQLSDTVGMPPSPFHT